MGVSGCLKCSIGQRCARQRGAIAINDLIERMDLKGSENELGPNPIYGILQTLACVRICRC